VLESFVESSDLEKIDDDRTIDSVERDTHSELREILFSASVVDETSLGGDVEMELESVLRGEERPVLDDVGLFSSSDWDWDLDTSESENGCLRVNRVDDGECRSVVEYDGLNELADIASVGEL